MPNQIQNPNFKNFPTQPGIYLFYDKKGELLYVGKATNLKLRVRSYFDLSFRPTRSGAYALSGERRNPLKTVDERDSSTPLRSAQNDKKNAARPIEEMIHEVKNIKYKTTDSVLEAIILESIYIKKFQPKYNVLGRDDKSWNYIVITDDTYPQVTAVRGHELHNVILSKAKDPLKSKNGRDSSATPQNDKSRFGPYPGLKTRETLKILRRLFKFSTCRPNQKRACLYRQMGECLGVCTNEISPADYRQKVIGPLKLFLQGKKEQVIKNLEKNMRTAASHQKFEEAGRLRNQISALRRLQDMALIGNDFYTQTKKINTGERIEGYDISNISGTSAVGSMVVFTDKEPDKNQYRKFKIRTITQANDVGMLKEVLERRFKNNWPLPQLILIDGGLPQVNTAKHVLRQQKLLIPVVGIAKGPDRKKNEIVGQIGNFELKTLIAVRDEAHRFALAYHRKLRSGGLTKPSILVV